MVGGREGRVPHDDSIGHESQIIKSPFQTPSSLFYLAGWWSVRGRYAESNTDNEDSSLSSIDMAWD